MKIMAPEVEAFFFIFSSFTCVDPGSEYGYGCNLDPDPQHLVAQRFVLLH